MSFRKNLALKRKLIAAAIRMLIRLCVEVLINAFQS
jgi:hypothetical protein